MIQDTFDSFSRVIFELTISSNMSLNIRTLAQYEQTRGNKYAILLK